MDKLKERWQTVPDKTRKIIKAIAGGTAAIALIAILALYLLGNDSDYSTLFTGLSQDEAREVVGLLQDEGIDYRYNINDGAIRVPESTVEQTRVNLLSRGYPKSGFAYDMYLNNTGLMTTESDKKLITRYELQDRLGATIRMFEGVQDAKVTITEGADALYAWEDTSSADASASVMITMRGGSTLTADKAQAVKNLISHAVKGMNFTNVAVFDAETMMEVNGSGDGSSSSSSATDLASLTSLVESNIAANVRRVLEQLYGSGNVAVSVKGTLNMERLIQESTQYSTPEKIDENDKTGLLEREDVTSEGSQAANQNAGGLVGADANADVPRYTNEDGTAATADQYSNYTASREWLFNVLKEQRQIDPGILEDTSIGVVVITDRTDTPTQEQLIRLVANSAGIPVETAADKITVIRDSGVVTDVPTPPDKPVSGGVVNVIQSLPLPILIAIAAGVLLLILLVVLLLLRSRKRRKSQVVMEGDEFIDGDALSADDLIGGEDGLAVAEEGAGVTALPGGVDEEDEFTKNEEIMNLRMQRSLRLKQNIGDFVDQNPQIAAKLVQSWLRGEEADDDGRGKHANRSK
ncbi:MAG: flagellar M-ring protein FliF [Hungatella sp.]|nr:flagellar M-ring protein FliF [Hungatella sp.]